MIFRAGLAAGGKPARVKIIARGTVFTKAASLRGVERARVNAWPRQVCACGSTIQTEPIPLTWVGRWILADQ